ncbi:hypothetical protein HUE87_12555 [Candidatus Sulfurimonas marisnigri]|uniref:PilZ domain-containing protein n=1 Tax=Candidatus Sulfurimonas marisnigri TaxID=2740405 RepID=A0A7S7M050_9BACT|nr:hypothetical protein [Candidatus Sulfurimonas marisnigri]QOY54668.1 hypothetical protein HUE87_12555 [Candidatus Sulfurimonas marisnigri]
MSLCHLYFKTSSSEHIKKILDSFDNSISLDIYELNTVDNFDIYIIELDEANKNISIKLKNLLKEKANFLIYFLIPKKYNLMLFQLTYLLGTKDIITQNQDTDKIIAKIKIDREIYLQDFFKRLVGEITFQTQNFMIYKNRNLIYISNELLNLFECNNFEIFKEKISNELDIKELLIDDIVIKKSMAYNNRKKNYIFESVSTTTNEKIIYIELDTSTPKQLNFISSRVGFVELLKEKHIQSNITHKQLSCITISIQNIEKLQKELSIVDLENLFSKLLSFMESILEKRLIFAQLERNFYVTLFEDINFEDINVIADDFHTRILNYIANQKYKPLIDVFTFDLNSLDFGDILITFDNIKSKNFTHKEMHCDYLQYTSNTQIIINEKNLLDDAFDDDIQFKLLNIYNGLVINTPSKIVKITNDMVYITFEQLQGVVMKIEQETVLQSSSFLYDIRAEIKQIDLKKRIAILENFQFLKTNANSRKYARVTTFSKIPISMLIDGNTINGNINDLSIKSIAFKVKYTEKIESMKSRDVLLVFNIPKSKSDNGYMQLRLGAKVIMSTAKDIDGYCKIVCDLDEDSNDDSMLMEYVYERQKELIIEVKKMSKLN